MCVQYMAWAVLICIDPLLPLPQDAFCHAPSFHPPFKGITVIVYQHLLRLFHLQHLSRPAPEKEVRRQRVGACWPQDAAATAPRGRWPKRAGPAPTSDIPPAHTRHEKQVLVPVFHQEGRTAGEEAIKRQTLCLPNTLNILKSLMAFDQPCLSRARPLNFREYQTWASKN